LELPSGQSEVTIFVDPDTESILTTNHTDAAGNSNLILARLFLDRLGALNHVLRFAGLLSTRSVYIMNAPTPWSESPLSRIVPPGSQ